MYIDDDKFYKFTTINDHIGT